MGPNVPVYLIPRVLSPPEKHELDFGIARVLDRPFQIPYIRSEHERNGPTTFWVRIINDRIAFPLLQYTEKATKWN